MGSLTNIYLERSENEIFAAGSLKKLSNDLKAKQGFELPAGITFYSAVISHSYYAIFYAAKAMLLTKGIKTESPEIHRKTIEAFETHLVRTGILGVKLLRIYRTAAIQADSLLEIFKEEKWKRGNFTYRTIPQANEKPAEDSLKNAKTFVSNILKMTAQC